MTVSPNVRKHRSAGESALHWRVHRGAVCRKPDGPQVASLMVLLELPEQLANSGGGSAGVCVCECVSRPRPFPDHRRALPVEKERAAGVLLKPPEPLVTRVIGREFST